MIDDKTRIKDILKSIARIIEITDCNYETFINSIEKQGKTITAMRNIIVHEYMRTDYRIIWQTKI